MENWMKQIKKIIKSCIVIAAMLIFTIDCYAENAEVKRHIIFIVDFSGSVGDNLNNYWKIIKLVTGCNKSETGTKNLCENIKGGDRITVLKITGQSRRKPEIMADSYFPEKGFFDSRLRHEKKLKKIKTSFRDKLLNGFEEAAQANNTEILASLRLAGKYFDDVKGEKKIVIILSDMIEESEFYNFRRNIQPKSILDKEETAHRLPNLSNIIIYVSGAYAGNDTKYDEIMRFWGEYFNKTGAKLKNYTSEMIVFDE